MEQLNPHSKNENGNREYNNSKKILSSIAIIQGLVYLTSAAYETITGQKASNLLDDFQDRLPDILTRAIENFDSASTIIKASLASAFLSAGLYLRGFWSNKEHQGNNKQNK